MLKFSKANAKLESLHDVPELGRWLLNGRKVYSLDLLSGWSCPFASDCLSKVHETGKFSPSGNPKVKLKDGPNTQFRCFSASQEALLPNVYAKRKHNYDTLKGLKSFTCMTERLCADLPKKCGILRFHVGGDFFNADYFLAAIHTAKANPDRELGLEIDHDDSHAAVPEWRNNSFALLVHGVQPKGSKAAEALKILKRDKVKHSYSRKGVMMST